MIVIIFLEKLPSEIKEIIGAEVTDNSDRVMICSTTIPSTSNTLNNLLVHESSHYSYIQKEFNDKKEDIINIFSAYVAPLIKEIYHPELLQERRLNIDAAEYEQHIDANLYKSSKKKKLHHIDSGDYWPTSIKRQFSGFLFLPLRNILQI